MHVFTAHIGLMAFAFLGILVLGMIGIISYANAKQCLLKKIKVVSAIYTCLFAAGLFVNASIFSSNTIIGYETEKVTETKVSTSATSSIIIEIATWVKNKLLN